MANTDYRNTDTRTDSGMSGGTMSSSAVDTTARGGLGALDWIALVLLIIGGLNWALVGLFDFDLVAAIFGNMSAISRIVYALVGLAALYTLYLATRINRRFA